MRSTRPDPIRPGPGQESVWDYPRPPAVQPSDKEVIVRWGEVVIASTRRAFRVLETSHPPNWYLPMADIRAEVFRPSTARATFCEWKGVATYLDLVVPGSGTISALAWTYENPDPDYQMLLGHLALYPDPLACTVDGERVRGQDGGYYGGWVTDDVVGPFKGGAGSQGW